MVLLIYVAVQDREAFAIYGDEGIHTKVDADFWDTTKDGYARSF